MNIDLFRTFLAAASHFDPADPALRDESFQMAQWAVQTQAAGALSQMSARQVAGSGPLADTVRGLQDMQNQWQAADKQGEGDKNLAETARKHMADLDAHMREIDERLGKEFPRYAELVSAKPVSIADAQGVLRPDEALVSFTFSDDEAYLFVIRKGLAKFFILSVKRDDIAKLVSDVRDSLDAKGRSLYRTAAFRRGEGA